MADFCRILSCDHQKPVFCPFCIFWTAVQLFLQSARVTSKSARADSDRSDLVSPNLQIIINDDTLFSDQKAEAELLSRLQDVTFKSAKEILEQMTTFGGFPEPFLKASNCFANKWRRDYKIFL